VTARNPIPPDAFESALESLDTEKFTALVGEAYRAAADAVDVDAPHVTVVNGDRRTELLAVTTESERADGADHDAVVVARDSLLDGHDFGADTAVVTPADLRQRLLYAMPPAEADAIADRILDTPMRSTTYDGASATGAAAGGGDGDDDAAVAEAAATPQPDPGQATDSTPSDAFESLDTAAATGTAAGVSEDVAPSRSDSRTAQSQFSDPPSERNYPKRLVAVVAVVALLAAAAVGAATVGGGLPLGGDGAAGVDGDADAGSSPTESDAVDRDAESADESDATASDDDGATAANETTDGDPTDGTAGEAARNTAVAPTCERSAIQVVQVQMNALRYNNETTNDGIRAARAFATPQNRRAVGSIDQFVSLFETPTYAPMLTYDTAQYSVPRIDNGTAEIDVITRENGGVTGRYEFRLELIPGGSAETNDDLGGVDGCWMTDAVAASTD
jgi:hypothetical protein